MPIWEEEVKRLGFANEKEMWITLYGKGGLNSLCKEFKVSQFTIRRKLYEHGIKIKKRGGPQLVKVKNFDAALNLRIQTEGWAAIAKELGCTVHALRWNKRRWLKAQEANQPVSSSPERGREAPLPSDSEGPKEPAMPALPADPHREP